MQFETKRKQHNISKYFTHIQHDVNFVFNKIQKNTHNKQQYQFTYNYLNNDLTYKSYFKLTHYIYDAY